jgi:hypothetical protein
VLPPLFRERCLTAPATTFIFPAVNAYFCRPAAPAFEIALGDELNAGDSAVLQILSIERQQIKAPCTKIVIGTRYERLFSSI